MIKEALGNHKKVLSVIHIRVHTTDAPVPELLNPLSHVQTTELSLESCEQTAFGSHVCRLGSQLSKIRRPQR